MDISRSRSRRVKITYPIHWPQTKNGGHLLNPNAARELNDGRVVSVGKDTTVRLWKDQQNIKTFYCHTDSVNDVDVLESSTSPLVVTAGNDYRVCLLDINRSSSSPQQQHTEHTDAVKRVRFTVDNHLISAGLDGKVILWDVAHRQLISRSGIDTGVFSIGMQPSATRAIMGCMKGALYSMDSRESSGKCRVYQPHAHVGTVRDITFIDDTTFATGGSDGVVRLWDLRNPRQAYKLHCQLHREPIFSIATKDSYILSASRDGQVLLTDPQSMQTATLMQMNYPILDISWNPTTSNVTVCSNKANVELFELSTGFDEDDDDIHIVSTAYRTPTHTSQNVSALGGGGAANNNNASIMDASAMATPSRVDIILDDASEQLVPIEGRRYGRCRYRELNHPSKKAEKLWCTATVQPRIREREFSVGSSNGLAPKYTLRGSSDGFVSARLLSDKRHALAMTANNAIELWNIIEMRRIDGPHSSAKTMKEAVRICGPFAYGASWCRVDCAWGALRITLSHDEAFNAQANLWEYKYLSSIGTGSNGNNSNSTSLSIHKFSRSDRREMEKSIINVGEEILRMWNHNKSEVYVVQTKQGEAGGAASSAGAIASGSSSSTTTSANTGPSSVRAQFTDGADGKMPTWAVTCLTSGPAARTSAGASATVNVTLEPWDVPPSKYKTINLSVPKNRSVADLCAEVVAQNKISFVTIGELSDSRINGSPGTMACADEMIEFIAVGHDSHAEGGDHEDEDDNASGSDAGSEHSPTGASGSSAASERERERIVDPMMMVVTAFYTYKERGAGTLRLKYRSRKSPKVKVDDL